MPDFAQLYNLTFGNLDAALGDWEQTVRDMRNLSEEAHDGLRAKTAEVSWSGENAGISQQFIYVTSTQFSYAHSQAEAIHTILKDLRDRQRQHQNELLELESVAREEGVYIRSDGVVTPRSHDEYMDRLGPEVDAVGGARGQAAVDSMTARIEEVLAHSEEADAIAARALRDIVGEDRDFFEPAGLIGMDNAEQQQGESDAREFEALVDAGAWESEEGAARMSEILQTQRGNEYFATYLATHMGAAETMTFWAGALEHPGYPEPSEEYVESIRSMRENLGMVLGEASRSQAPGMDEWREEMISQGSDHFGPTPDGPYGFQLTSDLMNYGNWGDEFLEDYGDALIGFELEGGGANNVWTQSVDPATYQTLLDEDLRLDPMTGLMEGLSNHPSAANRFFTYSGDDPRDNLTYLLSERDYPTSVDAGSEAGGIMAREAAGRAIYAATTGLDPDEPIPADPPGHNPMRSQLFNRVLEIEAGMADSLPPEFRESTAAMLGNYRHEVFQTASDVVNSEAPLVTRHLSEVLNQISRTPEAYGALQQAMIVEYVEQIQADETGHPDYTLSSIGQSVGFIEQGRFAALEIDQQSPKWAGQDLWNWTGYLVGDIPVVGATLENGVNQLSAQWVEQEQQALAAEYQISRGDYLEEENLYLNEVCRQWLELNPEAPSYLEGVNSERWGNEARRSLRDAANDGRINAAGAVGD